MQFFMANTSPLQPPQNIFLEQMRDQMRRMLVRLEEIRALTSAASGAWTPAVDILETEDSIQIKVEMPGVSIENVRATVLDHVLKIEGRKERENLNENSPSELERPIRFLCLERSYGSFAFTIALRWQVDVSNVSAKMNEGVLTIHLPKTQTAGREIAIPIKE